MIKPQFPYPGNQIIISSGRVLLHAKDDVIFLFGKKGIGISTRATLNIDAIERTIINSNKIELGLRAETEGYRVIKGEVALQQLDRLLDALQALGSALEQISVESLAKAVPMIQMSAGDLKNIAVSVKGQLRSKALSDVTYTR